MADLEAEERGVRIAVEGCVSSVDFSIDSVPFLLYAGLISPVHHRLSRQSSPSFRSLLQLGWATKANSNTRAMALYTPYTPHSKSHADRRAGTVLIFSS